jgi:hypothetical protein
VSEKGENGESRGNREPRGRNPSLPSNQLISSFFKSIAQRFREAVHEVTGSSLRPSSRRFAGGDPVKFELPAKPDMHWTKGTPDVRDFTWDPLMWMHFWDWDQAIAAYDNQQMLESDQSLFPYLQAC